MDGVSAPKWTLQWKVRGRFESGCALYERPESPADLSVNDRGMWSHTYVYLARQGHLRVVAWRSESSGFEIVLTPQEIKAYARRPGIFGDNPTCTSCGKPVTKGFCRMVYDPTLATRRS